MMNIAEILASPNTIYVIILSVILIILAIIAGLHRNLAYAILSLFAFSVVTGILFFVVNAPYVGIVQIAVFSGAVIVLFIFVFILTRGGVAEVE